MEISSVPIRVVIADDHALFRDGLRRLFDSAGDVEIVGEAERGEDAVRLVEEVAPDVVLLDVSMPGLSGLEAAQVIASTSPRTRVIMLTVHSDEEILFRAIKAGAVGYLLKDTSPKELLEAIRIVHQGEALLDPRMATKVVREFAKMREARDTGPAWTPLTARETEILEHVAAGLTNKEIAQRLTISERTVKNHLSNIMQKLHVNTRTQAAVLALQAGLVRQRTV